MLCIATEDDWNVAVMDTALLSSNWQKLVINLGLPLHVIDSIKMEVSPSDSWSEALKQWIKQNYDTKKYGEPSWRTLLRAVALVDKLRFKTLADKHKGMNKLFLPFNNYTMYIGFKNLVLPLMAIIPIHHSCAMCIHHK